MTEKINSILLIIKRNRRIIKFNKNKPLKLNLGCGLAVEKSWVNIDGSLNSLFANFPNFIHKLVFKLSGARDYYSIKEYCNILSKNNFIHHDLSYNIPFNDGIVDFIFTSHFVEHLFKRDAENFLNEAFRVLKKGGKLRISVPDLNFAVNQYLQGKKKEMLENYFFVDHNDNHFSRHKYMYDFEILETILEKIGFVNIMKCDYKKGSLPNLNILDNRPEDSLFIEVMKPF